MARSTNRRVIAAPTSEGPLLVVDDFRTHFATDAGLVRAVDGVSLTLERGKTLGIVGESGSGKTVLSRSVMGLLTARNVVRSGSVRLNGQELVGASPSQLRALWGTDMAMVFQDPMTSLNPVMKIGRQITEGLRYHLELPKDEALAQALQLLESVGIPDPRRRLEQYPHELSGGMRQRVTIAIALACGPHLLFADEPTTALDVTVQAQILDLLQQQQRERYMAMVLVTHDLGVVAGRTDEIAVMYAGQIVEKAPTRTLFTDVRMPYTEALLKSIPKLEEPSHTRLQIIGGRPPDLLRPPSGCRFAPRCPYAQAKCHTEPPPLVEAETPGHEFRCWFPVGTSAGQEALERNLAQHLPAAEAAVTGDSHAAGLVEAVSDTGGDL
ncbi:MAG TPA: ABC transporter ATP-binding protein [Acidimicrobiales bacterium]|jgi:oligopeptide/dipeptide ABC transporter ATP-binding protein|nr:ABC transporter ATP-binding protein [Acidimicrobiales bacterium]